MHISHEFHVPIVARDEAPLRVSIERADGTVIVSYPLLHRVTDGDPPIAPQPGGARGYESGDRIAAENRPHYSTLGSVSIRTHGTHEANCPDVDMYVKHVPYKSVEEIAAMVRQRFAAHDVATAIADAILEQNLMVHEECGQCGLVCAHGIACDQRQDHQSMHEGCGGGCDAENMQDRWRIPGAEDDAGMCPRCHQWVPGQHELGVRRHVACGYCAHDARFGVREFGKVDPVYYMCETCGHVVPEGE